METNARHFIIGLFTILVVLALLAFALWAGRFSTHAKFQYVNVVFTEAVSGLSVGGSVQFNGIRVGDVENLRIDPDNPRNVIAHIRVNTDTPVSQDTKATLEFSGLTGIAFIQLSGGSKFSPPLAEEDGIPVIIADVSALQKLLAGGEDLALTVNEVLGRVSRVLSEENVMRINNTLTHVEQLSGSIADQGQPITELIASAKQTAEQLKTTIASANKAVNTVDGNLPALMRKLQDSLTQLEATTASAQAMLEENRNSVKRFSEQGLTQVGPALDDLRDTLHSIRRVTKDLEDNPNGLVIGRDRPKEYQP